MKPPIRALALLASVFLAPHARAVPTIANVFARDVTNLDGKWNAIVDPYDVGYLDYRGHPYDLSNPPQGGFFLDAKPADRTEFVEYDFDHSPTLMVPRDWNTQDPRLWAYEGTVWYRRIFQVDRPDPSHRLFLYFAGANYETDVYLNGRKLGRHVGGFTPFEFEVTDVARPGANTLVVRVNSQRRADGVPTLNTDWWNYGGLTRDVLLVRTPQTFIADYSLVLQRGGAAIDATLQLDGPGLAEPVTISIPELGVQVQANTDAHGRLAISLPLDPRRLTAWSPDHPRRYGVQIQTPSDSVAERMGFRTIEVRGHDILLNGHPIFLRGVSLHEENPLRGGRAWSEEDARLLLGWAKELGCNYVRLAHYPHNEHMARVAEELGLLVWEEIPVYWTIQFDNPQTQENALAQLDALVRRDRNRASVIIWSVGNETPPGEARLRFLRTLIERARSLDPTRLVTAAMEVRNGGDAGDTRIVDDALGQYTDLVSFNEYFGWYDGLPDRAARVRFDIRYDKPVVISEFGGEAVQGLHGDRLTRWTEEFQEDVYRKTFPMLERIPQFRGMTPWILCDFRSPRRLLPNAQDGWNRKGLIGENGVRKKAFYALQEYYRKKQAEETP